MIGRTAERRNAARAAVLLVALAGISGVGMLAVRRIVAGSPAQPRASAVDGWRVTGLRHTEHGETGGTVRLRAGELALRRVRVGPFRLGFARRLVGRDIDILVRDGGASGSEHASAGWRHAEAGGMVAAVEVERMRLRVRREGASFEVTARRVAAGWADDGRVRLRGPVRVRGADVAVTLPELDFDPRSGRFVAEPGRVDQSVVTRVNAAMAGVGDTTGGHLRSLMARLAAATQRLP